MENNLLTSAPLSSYAIVVSEDGTKQDNAAYTAIQQVVNGFVPCALDYAFSYNINYTNVIDPDDELKFEPGVDALIPVVVTNASLFRLKPEIKDLDLIRKASGPTEVADNVDWDMVLSRRTRAPGGAKHKCRSTAYKEVSRTRVPIPEH